MNASSIQLVVAVDVVDTSDTLFLFQTVVRHLVNDPAAVLASVVPLYICYDGA